MRFKDKIVVVTGGSMGIGEAIAKAFVDEGAKVVITSRDAARAEAARGRIGSPERTLAVASNVRVRAEIDRLVQDVRARYGRIDIFINNAGYGHIDSIAAASMQDVRAVFDTNVFGAMDCMQAVFPVMKQQGSGTIVNISSIAGHITVPHMSVYCATKHALNALSRAARLEMGRSNVHVLTVCPGYIATDFATNAVKGSDAMRLGRAASAGIPAERVAEAVLDGVERKKREIVVPKRDWILIWAYRFIPRLLEKKMIEGLKPAHEVIAAAQAARKN